MGTTRRMFDSLLNIHAFSNFAFIAEQVLFAVRRTTRKDRHARRVHPRESEEKNAR